MGSDRRVSKSQLKAYLYGWVWTEENVVNKARSVSEKRDELINEIKKIINELGT